LAAGILLMNITPLTEVLLSTVFVEQTSTCCTKTCDTDGEEDCSREVRNPFLSCCAPVLIAPNVDNVDVSIDVPKLKHISFYRSIEGELIECEVWQPPEVLA
jgi:hypothetical protein